MTRSAALTPEGLAQAPCSAPMAWAVAADYRGKPKVGHSRYEFREGADWSIELLTMQFGNRNFRAVEVGGDESSDAVEKRLNDTPNDGVERQDAAKGAWHAE